MTPLSEAAAAVELVEGLGYSKAKAARVLGLPRTTIFDIIEGNAGWDQRRNTPVFDAYRRQQKDLLIHAMTEGAKQALAHAFKPEVLDKASHLQAVTSAGILIDKTRLLAGESTANVAVATTNTVLNQESVLEALGKVIGQATQVADMSAQASVAGDDVKSSTPSAGAGAAARVG